MAFQLSDELRCHLDARTDYCGVSDTNHQFLYQNYMFAKTSGFRSQRACEGKIYEEIPSPISQCAEIFRSQECRVMETQVPIQVFDIHQCYDDQWRAWLGSTAPFIFRGEVVGTIWGGDDCTSPPMIELAAYLSDRGGCYGSYYVGSAYQPLALSERQQQISFLSLRGLSPLQMARVLGQSLAHLQQQRAALWAYLGVDNDDDFKHRLSELGYLQWLPTLFLPNTIGNRSKALFEVCA